MERAKSPIFRSMSPGDWKDAWAGSTSVRNGGGFAGKLRECGVIELLSVVGEISPGFLHKPEAGDVFQEAKRSGDAELIGE